MALVIEDVVGDAHSATSPAAFRERVLGRLATELGADSGIFVRIADGRVTAPHGFLNKDRYQHLAMAYAARADRHQTFQQRMWVALGREGACVDTEIFAARERDRLPFYREIIRPQRIRSQLVIGLEVHGRRVGAIYLCRHGRGRGFRREDTATARPLIPVLALAQRAFDAAHAPASGGALDRLTPRQREIAHHVASGLSNAEIATVLGCSPHTVRNHLVMIFDALGIESRTRLALLTRASMPA